MAVSAEFALAQGFGQAAGMACGFIYVRVMPTSEYATYALCMTALSMITVGSDLGLTGSLNFFWRKSLQDASEIGPKIAAIRKIRVMLYWVALAVAGLTLLSSTRQGAVPTSVIVFCFVLVAAIAFVQLRTSIDIAILRLEGQQRLSYYCESAGSGARLCVAALMLLTGIATAWVGLIGGLIGAGLTQAGTFLADKKKLTISHTVSSVDWRDIRNYLLPLFPSVLIFMIQEPLVMALIATRTGMTAVAEVFALGRITAIYAVLGAFAYIVLTPVLARITDNARFMRVTTLCFGALCFSAAVALSVARFVPELLLLLVGDQYAHLHRELLVATATTSATVLASFLILTARVKGWVKLDPYFALLQMAVIVVLCFVWRFESTRAVLELSLALACSSLASAIGIFGIGILKPALVSVVEEADCKSSMAT